MSHAIIKIGLRLHDVCSSGDVTFERVQDAFQCSRAQAYRYIQAWHAYRRERDPPEPCVRHPARRVLCRWARK